MARKPVQGATVITLGADPLGAPYAAPVATEARELIDAWISRGRARTVEQDGMGWWVARAHGVLVKRRRFARGLAEQLREMP